MVDEPKVFRKCQVAIHNVHSLLSYDASSEHLRSYLLIFNKINRTLTDLKIAVGWVEPYSFSSGISILKELYKDSFIDLVTKNNPFMKLIPK